uniref:Uncharacterized protein n=1 Tax=Arundo donax TaxID=35708 RepID=A0A0A9I0F5_ARUDO
MQAVDSFVAWAMLVFYYQNEIIDSYEDRA